MNSRTHLPAAANGRPLFSLAGYRVTARRRDFTVALVRLAESPRQAANFAQAAGDYLRANMGRHDLVAVRTEEWVGTLTAGEWLPTSRWQSVLAHRFDGRNAAPDNERSSRWPQTGDTVECVLLSAKTRKGGWRARLLTRDVSGPITNTGDVPSTVAAGQVLPLRVGAISHDGLRIQFHWAAASRNGR